MFFLIFSHAEPANLLLRARARLCRAHRERVGAHREPTDGDDVRRQLAEDHLPEHGHRLGLTERELAVEVLVALGSRDENEGLFRPVLVGVSGELVEQNLSGIHDRQPNTSLACRIVAELAR